MRKIRFKGIRVIRSIVSVILVVACLISTTACSSAQKQQEEGRALVTKFMDLAMVRSIDEMSDYCANKREAMAVLSDYGSAVEAFNAMAGYCVDIVLSYSTYEINSMSFTNSGDQAVVVVSVILPDYEDVLDSLPKDLDAFEEGIEYVNSTKKVSFSVDITYSSGRWRVDDAAVIAEKIYSPLLHSDFNFVQVSCREMLESTSFYMTNSGTNGYINATFIELDLFPKEEYIEGGYSWTYRYEVYNNHGNDLIYSSESITTDSGLVRCTLHPEDAELVAEEGVFFPTDTYRFIVYDYDNVTVKNVVCNVLYDSGYGSTPFYADDISESIEVTNDGVSPYCEYLQYSYWIGDTYDYSVYDTKTPLLSYDITPIDTASYEGFVWEYSYSLSYYNTDTEAYEEIYVSDLLTDSGSSIRINIAAELVDPSSVSFSPGEYMLVVYDSAGNTILTDTCSVLDQAQ